MGAPLHDDTLLKDNDLICALDGRQSVGDHDHRLGQLLILEDFIEGLLDLVL